MAERDDDDSWKAAWLPVIAHIGDLLFPPRTIRRADPVEVSYPSVTLALVPTRPEADTCRACRRLVPM